MKFYPALLLFSVLLFSGCTYVDRDLVTMSTPEYDRCSGKLVGVRVDRYNPDRMYYQDSDNYNY